MENLFTNMHSNMKPLAEKMRPKTLNEFVGQQHILGQGKLLRRLIEAKRVPSVIFYGPPGIGKTTLASIIAESAGARFVKLNAVSSGVADVKVVIEDAKKHFEMYGKKTYLLLDECHRWSKAQSEFGINDYTCRKLVNKLFKEGRLTYLTEKVIRRHRRLIKNG